MSCCCARPSQAIIGAGICTLIFFVPFAFYGLVKICFHYSEQEHQSLSLISTITLVGAVVLTVVGLIGRCTKNVQLLSAIFWLCLCWSGFAIAMTLWAAVVATQGRMEAEGKILAAGTVIIACAGFILSPLLWFTYELYAYRRQLREQPGDSSSDNEEKAFIRHQAKIDRRGSSDMSRDPASVAAELARPAGRRRRGRRSEKRYSKVQTVSSEESSGGELPTYDSRMSSLR
ncbi:uncharacterized protein JCM6883_004387 [Sporobolomyces salmoneus]|uniref:uncharacterized protein n=1 Tax=Sporobolomyces salmoneus TaxID=183962 RepID=UPI00316B8CA8